MTCGLKENITSRGQLGSGKGDGKALKENGIILRCWILILGTPGFTLWLHVGNRSVLTAEKQKLTFYPTTPQRKKAFGYCCFDKTLRVWGGFVRSPGPLPSVGPVLMTMLVAPFEQSWANFSTKVQMGTSWCLRSDGVRGGEHSFERSKTKMTFLRSPLFVLSKKCMRF